MLFYKHDSTLTDCRVCNESRYKTSEQGKVPHLGATEPPTDPPIYLDHNHEGGRHCSAIGDEECLDVDPMALTPEIQGQLWEKVVGGRKRNRMSEFNKVSDFINLTGQPRHSCSNITSEIESLRTMLESMWEHRRIEQEARAERWRKYEEDKRQQETTRQQFEAFMALFQNPEHMQFFIQQFHNQKNQNPPK